MADPKKPAAPATDAKKADARTPRQKFQEIGGGRVTKAIKAVRALGNLSNRAAYEFNQTDFDKLKSALDREVEAVYRKFQGALDGKTPSAGGGEFSF